MDTDLLKPTAEVAAALADGRPVVVLESTLITHGLPYPDNLAAARRSEEAVRAGGAVPATVALHDGRILVGLTPSQLEELAQLSGCPKVSRQNLAGVLGRPGWAGTTVSATMIAAQLAGIGVFATGGIGGVHRGGQVSMDISADLDELARTPVAVVCAGPKSILDVPRTLEVLETRGVPVVAWGTDELPGFFSRGAACAPRYGSTGQPRRPTWCDGTPGWGWAAASSSACPCPEAAALPQDEAEAAIEQAVREMDARGVHGPAATPAILSRVAQITGGRSVRANLALIEHDAAIAASLAVALSVLAGPG